MVYTYMEQEKMRVLDAFMNDGRVKRVPSSAEKKYILLKEISKRFDHGVTYAETEINSILPNIFPSGGYVEQRRYLIAFGLLRGNSDGRVYQMMGIEN